MNLFLCDPGPDPYIKFIKNYDNYTNILRKKM